LPIGDRPAFQHITDQLRRFGFGPIAINTHHAASAFENTDTTGISLVHEPEILGTAGGVANAARVLGAGPVLVWNGDIHAEVDLAALVATHTRFVDQHGAIATILAAKNRVGEGKVGIGHGDFVARLRGTQTGREVFTADYVGVMMLAQKGRDLLPNVGCLVGDLLIPRLIAGDRVGVAWHAGDWVDIGSPDQYHAVNEAWRRKHSDIQSSAT